MHKLFPLIFLTLLSCTPMTPTDKPIERTYDCGQKHISTTEHGILDAGIKPVDLAGCVKHKVTSEGAMELRDIAPKHYRANLVYGHIIIYRNGTLVEIHLFP